MKLTSNNLIYRGEPCSRTANCCFPAITRMADGTLLVTWRVGSQKDSADGAIWMSRSTDEGRSWSPPRTLFAAAEVEGRIDEPHYAPLTTLADGRLVATVMWVQRSNPADPLFNPCTEGILPLRTQFYGSHDQGATWSELSELDLSPYYSPLAITGPVLELPDGSLACQFEVNKNYEDTRPWRHSAAWKLSRDGGRTWPECVELANDPSGRLFYWDARAAVVDAERCLAAFWTFDRESQRDRMVHLSHSNNSGKTWSRPQELKIIGQVAEPVPLSRERLLLIVVDRFASRNIRAILSSHNGHTIEEDLVLYQQPSGRIDVGEKSSAVDYLQDMDLWTFGRVQAVADGNGRVWVVYYGGDRDSTGIYSAQLNVETAGPKPKQIQALAQPAFELY